MKGLLFAVLGGAFITLQGVANSRISQDIGTWQAATITQFTGFVTALLILLLFVRDRRWGGLKQVNPLYLTSGAFAAFIISSNITSIQLIGATITTSAVMIAQLGLTFMIDGNGWFGVKKQKLKIAHFIGIGMMIVGVIILGS